MCQAAFRDDGALPFRLLSEKPFLLPDNEGVKMNTSPVEWMIYRLTVFTVELLRSLSATPDRRLCSRRHWLCHYSAYAAMQLTPFMAGMIGGSALLGCFLAAWFWGGSPTISGGKKSHLQFYADYARFVLAIFCHHAEHLIGLRILIGIGLGGDYSSVTPCWLNFPRAAIAVFCWAIQCGVDRRLCAGKYCRTSLFSESPEAWRWLLASAALPAL